VAIGAVFFFSGAGERRLVLLGVNLVPRVTAHAEIIDLVPAIYDVGCRAFSTQDQNSSEMWSSDSPWQSAQPMLARAWATAMSSNVYFM